MTSPVSGTYDIEYLLGGSFFSDIYYGEAPILETLTTLSGSSDQFTSVEFQAGVTLFSGSILIGSATPSGVLQSFDFATKQVIRVHKVPELEEDNVEDFS